MSTSEIDLFHYGTIVGTHGLKGDLKVRPVDGQSPSLENATRVLLRKTSDSGEWYVPVRATLHKGKLLLRLLDHENINLVETLVGCDLFLLRSEVEEPEPGGHYWQELQGIAVTDKRCGEIGTLENKFTTAAHDVYVVEGPFGEVLIPVVDQFICAVDLAGKRMTVDLPEGLVPEPDAD